MKRKRTGVVRRPIKNRLIVRAATEKGTVNLASLDDAGDAALFAEQHAQGKATWVDRVHVCEAPGCSAVTPYNVCRKHANGPRVLVRDRQGETQGHTTEQRGDRLANQDDRGYPAHQETIGSNSDSGSPDLLRVIERADEAVNDPVMMELRLRAVDRRVVGQTILVDTGDQNQELLRLVNGEREAVGLHALKLHSVLIRAAQKHSQDQAEHDRINHYGSDGSTWADRVAAAGYPGASLENVRENVAAGQKDAVTAVGDWMESPGHRDAMLDRRIEHIGFGVAQGRSGWLYWTMDACSGGPDDDYEIHFR